ncbi:MAG: hypothetical protein K6E29_04610, partial [Cyanobacteria bacterium RUI128]|nr:hypothetical protein [Cyanobacteria bacterium RUI128]
MKKRQSKIAIKLSALIYLICVYCACVVNASTISVSDFPGLAAAIQDSVNLYSTITLSRSISASEMDTYPLGTQASDSLTITGGSYNLSATNNEGIFIDSGKTLTISNFQRIKGFQSEQGGFIKNAGTVTISNLWLTENKNTTSGLISSYGGALYNSGTMNVSNVTFEQNISTATSSGSSYGGAIFSSGNLTVDSSIFNNNSTVANLAYGGAIYSTGTISISNSTFTTNYINNTVSALGGAIYSTSDLTIVNSSFINNYVRSPIAHAGAIYAENNVSITADNSTVQFSTNYLSTDMATKVYEAIYMANSSATLSFVAQNSGSFEFRDIIDGASGYNVSMSGTANSEFDLYNAIKNADITLQSITLKLLTGTNNDGVQSSADLSTSTLNAVSGAISLADTTIRTTNMGVLTSSANVLYSIDTRFASGTLSSDVLNLASGSSGTVTINSIGSLTVDSFGKTGTVGYNLITNTYTVKVLNNATAAIGLAISNSLESSFDKDIFVSDYLSGSKYVVSSSDFIGKIGISVNTAGDSLVFGIKNKLDTLAEVNQFTAQSAVERDFNLASATVPYTVTANTGETKPIGNMVVNGIAGSSIDYVNTYSGFEVPSGANLTIRTVNIKNAVSASGGSALTIASGGTVNVSGVTFTNNRSSGAGLKGGAIYNNGSLTLQNTNFTGNYSIGASNHGGAIYSDSNLTVKAASSNTVQFSGNYVAATAGGSKTYEAIYMGASSTLTLNPTSGGKIIFNDIINGASGYNVSITGDANASVRFNNAVQNAAITLATTQLILGTGNDAGSNSIMANFSGSSLNVQSGTVNMRDTLNSSYNLGTLTSAAGAKYNIDMKIVGSAIQADSFDVASGSSGTVTINSISGITISSVLNSFSVSDLINSPLSVQILRRSAPSDNIVLALSSAITSSTDFVKSYTLYDYYNSTTQKYVVASTDFIGSIGFYLNNTADSVMVGVLGVADLLNQTNIYVPVSTPYKDRYFTVAANTTYKVKANTGVTGNVGTMYVQGASKDNSIIDYKNIIDANEVRFSGFEVQSGATLEMSNIRIKNALTAGNGAVISNQGSVGASTTSGITNAIFEDNTALRGGVISNTGTVNRITNVVFRNNLATSATDNVYGGAIYNTGTFRYITNSSFEGNAAVANDSIGYSYGGAIYNSGSMTVSASFLNNYVKGATAQGGAIYSTNAITLLADSSNYSIQGNYTQSNGGAKVYNAIHMASTDSNKGLAIQTSGGGTWSIYDVITGGVGYYVNISSLDGTGVVNLYNQISNANVKLNNATLNVSGDSAYTDYTFYTFATTDATGTAGQAKSKIKLDVSLASGQTDTIRITSDSNTSSGYLTISDIVGVSASDITDNNVTIKVLYRASERNNTIKLALDSALETSLRKTIGIDKYFDAGSNSYKVKSTDYVGGVGVSLNATADSLVFGRLTGLDTLAQTNLFNSSGKDRYFILQNASTTYTAIANSSTTYASGTMYVQGAKSGENYSTINYANKSGFILGSGAKLNISNVKITGAKSSSSGAVIDTQGTLTLNDVIFDTNTVTTSSANITGGIIYNRANQSALSATFKNNTVTTTGKTIQGAVLYSNNTIDTIGGTFTSNKGVTSGAAGSGGSIFLNTGSVVYDLTSTFTSNIMQSSNNSVYGGALYNAGVIGKFSGSTYVSGQLAATFTSNSILTETSASAVARGGAMYNAGTIHTLNSAFSSNSASNMFGVAEGGALYHASGTITQLQNTFDTNYIYAENTSGIVKGGAVYTAGTIDSVTATFSGNYARASSANSYGGAIHNTGTITNLGGTFSNNYSQSDVGDNASGGAVSNDNRVTNVIAAFSGNKAYAGSGNATGGAFINNAGALVSSVTGSFVGNYAWSTNSTARGGAITNADSATISSIVTDFSNNYAHASSTAQGGAIFNTGTITSISGSFLNNYASGSTNTHGGAIYTNANLLFVSNADDENFEITGNYITTDGGATKDYEAIYVASPNKEIRFRINNSGSYTINDNIAGSDVYNLVLETASYSTGYVNLMGQMKNANAILNYTTLAIDTNTFAHSGSTLNANNGTVNLASDGVKNYNIYKLNSADTVKYNLDFDVNENTIDTLTVNSGSNGTVLIDYITDAEEINTEGIFQVIKYTGNMSTTSNRVQLAIGSINQNKVLLNAIYRQGDPAISTGYVFRLATTNYSNDSLNIAYQDGSDVIAALNKFQTAEERHYIFTSSTINYQVRRNFGINTNQSDMYIDGKVGGQNQNILFTNTETGQKFSGFILQTSSHLYADGITFNGAQSTYGAVIYADSEDSEKLSNITLWTVAFDSNTASSSGGAIYLGENSHLLMEDRTTTSTSGSGSTVTTVTPSSLTFVSNTATQTGGAIHNDSVVDSNASSISFRTNTAGDSGGAVYNTNKFNLNSKTVNFEGNYASSYGGAVYNAKDATFQIGLADVNTVLAVAFTGNGKSGNNYTAEGGAVFNEGKFIDLYYSNITATGNYAQSGGAFYNSAETIGAQGILDLQGTTLLKENKALGTGLRGDGGAIYNAGKLTINTKYWENSEISASVLHTSTLQGNIANNRGGAIYNTDKASIYRTNFTSNTATSGSGGAIYSSGQTYTESGTSYAGLRVSSTAFTSNTAGVSGGAVYIADNGSFYSRESSYTNNSAVSGGAIYLGNNTSASIFKPLYRTSGVDTTYNAYYFLTTAASGSTVYFDYSSSTYYGVDVKNNTATGGVGGALYIGPGATATVYGNRIDNNSATASATAAMGGAVYVAAGGKMTEPSTAQSTYNNLFMNSMRSNAATSTSGDALGGGLYNAGTVENLFGGLYDGALISSNKVVTTSGNAYGGGIYNVGVITNAVPNDSTQYYFSLRMDGNYAKSTSGYAAGGAIYNKPLVKDTNGKINHIDAYMSNNYAISSGNYAMGGAIYNAADSYIYGFRIGFAGNYASGKSASASDATMGGAVYNAGELGVADFVRSTNSYPYNNRAIDTVGSAYGGVLYNSGTITRVVGSNGSYLNNSNAAYAKFYVNYVTGAVNAAGGAIYNTNSIGSIIAYYEGNYATATSGDAMGGVLYNSGTIATLRYDQANTSSGYTNNRVTSTNGNAMGGAIYNSGTLTEILNGYMNNNRAVSTNKAAYGGAIYNSGSTINLYTGFTNNYVTGKTDAHGGAVYSTQNINLIANNSYIRSVKGNYATLNGTKTFEAIYMADNSKTLSIQSLGTSIWQIYDIISGVNGYNVTLTGSNNGNIKFMGSNAQIKNANVTFNTTNLTLAPNTLKDSNTVFNAVSGKIFTTDGVTDTYNVAKIISNSSVMYNIDMDLTNGGSTDVIKVSNGTSSGTITIDNINFIAASEGTYIMRVLNAPNSNIKLALSNGLIESTKDSGITSPIVYWYEKITQARYTMTLDTTVTTDDSIKVVVNNPSDSDTLALLNQYKDTTTAKHFVFETMDDVYKAGSNTGLTAYQATMTVDGVGSANYSINHSTIDYQGNYSGFEMKNSASTTLTFLYLNIRNAYSADNGAVLNASGSGAGNFYFNYGSAYNNVSDGYGGALYFANKGRIYNMTYVTYATNKAKQGGAIYYASGVNRNSTSYLRFFNNAAINPTGDALGGAIYNSGAWSTPGDYSIFYGNYAVGRNAFGGAIYNTGVAMALYPRLTATGSNAFNGITGSYLQNNYVVGTNDARGGAIYTTKNITLYYGGTYKGNYSMIVNSIAADGTYTAGARISDLLYVAAPSVVVNLYQSGTTLHLYDDISGNNPYTVTYGGSGSIYLYNKFDSNAKFTMAGASQNLYIVYKEDIPAQNGVSYLMSDGVQNTFAEAAFDATAGTVNLAYDNKIADYKFGKLTSTASVSYQINSNGTDDVATVETGTGSLGKYDTISVTNPDSSGTITINNISRFSGSATLGWYHIIRSPTSNLQLALGADLNNLPVSARLTNYATPETTLSAGNVARLWTTNMTNDTIYIVSQTAEAILAQENRFICHEDKTFEITSATKTYTV